MIGDRADLTGSRKSVRSAPIPGETMTQSAMRYCSTFISGFSDLIAEILPRKLPGATIETLYDGLVVYRASTPFSEIPKLRFFNNSFLILGQSQCSGQQNADRLVKRLFAKAQLAPAVSVIARKQVRSFRIVVSRENHTVAIASTLMAGFERTITQQLKLHVNRSLPDIEFWFLIRSEGLCLFGLRLTAVGKQRARKYAQGELRQELAHLLCLLSEPDGGDVFLDPFCGSGAIVLERVNNFPYRQIWAGDIDPQHVGALQRKSARQKNIKVVQWDALNLTEVVGHSVNKIVTDPPWGFFKNAELDFCEFYGKMLAEFSRVLSPRGVALILVGRKDEFERALAATASLRLSQKYNILVSGKKAGVYRLEPITKDAKANPKGPSEKEMMGDRTKAP
jgi:23S rRNA G2445 N2-methylase RlmL